jgi:hypothetical protein
MQARQTFRFGARAYGLEEQTLLFIGEALLDY